ncbi:MAG: DUF2917 domain-containing protein [Burkholderiales bacterium]|nr:DUF2917 domain-containing protein [Burkholderiales bacterium]
MIALEVEQSLRFESGCRVRIICLAGCLWVTQQGDPVDRFLQQGDSMVLAGTGLGLVSAWEPAMVEVQAIAPRRGMLHWAGWHRMLGRRACCLP